MVAHGRLDLPCDWGTYRLPVPRKRAVSSAVEHCFHTAGATGSIPVPPTIQNNNLGKFPQPVSLELGQIWWPNNPSVWFNP